VGDGAQPLGARALEDRGELRRRVAATIRSRKGRASRSVSMASAAERWRRKHRMSAAEIPVSRPASTAARCRPLTTVWIGTPRALWVWGSKKISARRTLSAAARLR
jgi:hypothetical protein